MSAIDSLPLLQVPLFSLLSIWGDLVEAWHGVNAYGSATAEIYAYRLQPYCPLALLHRDDPTHADSRAVGNGRCILTRWQLSAAELAALVAGADLYVSFLTPVESMPPMGVQVGDAGWRVA